ncbi:hypothetical protein T484DRAFT_3644132 [Baffinella frigidus]|nr:hypothetical protein T484DRAFT_3644132 [Cryptophyta sp. CCMP2293]
MAQASPCRRGSMMGLITGVAPLNRAASRRGSMADGYGGVKERMAQVLRGKEEMVQRLNFLHRKLEFMVDVKTKNLRKAEWMEEKDRSVARLNTMVAALREMLLDEEEDVTLSDEIENAGAADRTCTSDTDIQPLRTVIQMFAAAAAAPQPTPSFIHRIQTDLFNTFMDNFSPLAPLGSAETDVAETMRGRATGGALATTLSVASVQSAPLPLTVHRGDSPLGSLQRVQSLPKGMRRWTTTLIPKEMRRWTTTMQRLVRSVKHDGASASFDMAI